MRRIWLENGRICLWLDPSHIKYAVRVPGLKWNRKAKRHEVFATPLAASRLIHTLRGYDVTSDVTALATAYEPEVDAAPVTKTNPWKHQLAAFRFCYRRPASMLAMEMGTGKSKVAVDLVNTWDVKRVLIMSPLSVVNVWPREFTRHSHHPYHVLALSKGSVKKKAEKVREFILAHPSDHLVVVVNHESAWREPFCNLTSEFDAAIVDESHRAKDPNGRFSKFLQRCRGDFGYRLMLTGTPFARMPLDIIPQFRFLEPAAFGDSWFRAKNGWAEMGGFEGKQIVGLRKEREEEFANLVGKVAFFCTKEEAIELPPLLQEDRVCVMPPKIRKAYDQLAKDFFTYIKGEEVSAANALVKLLRLNQITSGHVKNDEGYIMTVGDHKVKLLADILADTKPPVVVFCRFLEDLRQVEKLAQSMGWTYHEVSGRVKELSDEAAMLPDTDILGVQIQSGGLGIDLTRASVGIFYSISYSLTDFDQAVARLHRPGQTRPTTMYHLLAENSIDVLMYRALMARRSTNEFIRDLARGEQDG